MLRVSTARVDAVSRLGGLGKALRHASAPAGSILAMAAKWMSLPSNVKTRPELALHNFCAAAGRSVYQRDGEFADGSVGDWAAMGGEPELVAVHAEDRGVERLTQASGALCDHVEHRLDVSWRTTDHAEDLGSRRLLSEAIGQLMVASLQLREQPHVL